MPSGAVQIGNRVGPRDGRGMGAVIQIESHPQGVYEDSPDKATNYEERVRGMKIVMVPSTQTGQDPPQLTPMISR